jgi:hypothetical protein
MSARTCETCTSTHRSAIEAEVARGAAIATTARKYDISRNSLRAHFEGKHHTDMNTVHSSSGETFEWDGRAGTLSVVRKDAPTDGIWAELIADWGLDPSDVEIVPGSVTVRGWDAPDGAGGFQRLRHYKATLRQREHLMDPTLVEELIKSIAKRPAVKAAKPVIDGVTFLVALSDWQIGKGNEARGGTPETVARVEGAARAAADRLRELIKAGRRIEKIALVGLGDLVEGCDGFYAMQAFSADLDDRSQDRVVRHLLLRVIDTFVEFGIPMEVFAVPGNHGENRLNGKAHTTWLDNRDLAAFEIVGEVCAQNPARYSHVVFVGDQRLNDDDLTMTTELSGAQCGFAHGHQFRSGANSQAKMEGWLKGQALGLTGIANARLLFAGHLHHFVMSESTGRTVIQVPAMDGGSRWFQATSGASAPAGMLTVCVGAAAGPRLWSDLLIV